MRKYLIITAVIVGAIAVAGIAYAATAAQTTSFKFKPATVPKNTYVKGLIKIHSHNDDANDPNAIPPPAIRAQLNFDNDFKFHLKGFAKCSVEKIENTTTNKAEHKCPGAKVGGGSAVAALATSPTTNANFPAVVTAFNGTHENCSHASTGKKGVILLHSRIGPPINSTSILCGVLKNSTAGSDYGKNLDVTIPPLQGGLGAIRDFKVKIKKRNYVNARCHDSNRTWNLKAKYTFAASSGAPPVTNKPTQKCHRS